MLAVISSHSGELSPDFIKLVDIVNCLPASSAITERFFFLRKTASRRNTETDFLWGPQRAHDRRLWESPKGFEAFEQWWTAKRKILNNLR